MALKDKGSTPLFLVFILLNLFNSFLKLLQNKSNTLYYPFFIFKFPLFIQFILFFIPLKSGYLLFKSNYIGIGYYTHIFKYLKKSNSFFIKKKLLYYFYYKSTSFLFIFKTRSRFFILNLLTNYKITQAQIAAILV